MVGARQSLTPPPATRAPLLVKRGKENEGRDRRMIPPSHVNLKFAA